MPRNNMILKTPDSWQAQSDLDCLVQASKINKDPKRLAAAQKLAASQLKTLAGISADMEEEAIEK